MLLTRSSASRAGLAAAALAAAVALAGCASSSGGTPAGSTSAASGIDQKTGAEISAAAQKAALAATSVHVKGAVGTTTLDLSIGGDSASGTMGVTGATLELVRVGAKYWVKGDAAFWAKNGVPAASATKLDGKYVDVSAQSAQFAGFASVKTLFSSAPAHASATKGAISTINGAEVISLKDTDGSLLFVATHGDPFPMRITNTGTNGGQLDFTAWNVPVTVTAPTADQVIDPATLQ